MFVNVFIHSQDNYSTSTLGPMLGLDIMISKNRHGPCVHRVYNPVGETSIIEIIILKKCTIGNRDKDWSWGGGGGFMTKPDQLKSHWDKATQTGKHKLHECYEGSLLNMQGY